MTERNWVAGGLPVYPRQFENRYLDDTKDGLL